MLLVFCSRLGTVRKPTSSRKAGAFMRTCSGIQKTTMISMTLTGGTGRHDDPFREQLDITFAD
jgi:hypothetical protein